MKVGSLSFGLPVSASTVSKPIFDIKATEDKNNISTPMLSVSGKNVPSFGSLAESASLKTSGGAFTDYPAQTAQEVLSLDHQQREENLRHYQKSIQIMLVVQ